MRRFGLDFSVVTHARVMSVTTSRKPEIRVGTQTPTHPGGRVKFKRDEDEEDDGRRRRGERKTMDGWEWTEERVL